MKLKDFIQKLLKYPEDIEVYTDCITTAPPFGEAALPNIRLRFYHQETEEECKKREEWLQRLREQEERRHEESFNSFAGRW